jgi:hypothetical protein
MPQDTDLHTTSLAWAVLFHHVGPCFSDAAGAILDHGDAAAMTKVLFAERSRVEQENDDL